jgi:hypothetical protein
VQIIQEPKKVALEINGILKRKKNEERAACLKIQYVYLLKKIYKMGCLEGSGVPVPYMERTVPKG